MKALGLFLIVAAAGCGGKVVFVEDGDGGGTGGSGASSGSGTNPADACAGFCAKLDACGFGSPSCATDCLLLSVPGCESEAADLVQCFADTLDPVACLPDECISESIKYATCAGASQPPPDPGE
jgi:hypothetical protein